MGSASPMRSAPPPVLPFPAAPPAPMSSPRAAPTGPPSSPGPPLPRATRARMTTPPRSSPMAASSAPVRATDDSPHHMDTARPSVSALWRDLTVPTVGDRRRSRPLPVLQRAATAPRDRRHRLVTPPPPPTPRRVGGALMPKTPPRRRCNPPRTHDHPAAAPECHRPRARPSWTPHNTPQHTHHTPTPPNTPPPRISPPPRNTPDKTSEQRR